jgi:hypothetical protein
VKPLPLQFGVCVGYNQTCRNGRWDADYSVVPQWAAVEGLLCDGLDNDCDSVVDDNLTPPLALNQSGVCQNTTKLCRSGAWREPDYTALPNYSLVERCDGLDNK